MPVDPQRVQAVFLAAVERADHADRAAVLDRECGVAAELRRRVEALLLAHDDPESLLARPAVVPELTVDEIPRNSGPRPAEDVGTVVAGRYKLLEQIGEGGMGTVWVAEQTHPVRRKVALKLIKAGMDSKTVLTRFEAERQALAMMDHPNIAKILDGGTTEAGRPFFVMEYVKGIPFTKYCDDARLSIADRLALFVPVCQAVQHAHQKGIIHRDLKPSNVLVCLYDGKPVPKVIDFGLAKAMHQPLTDHTLYTAHGVAMGTPLYMSPEQAEMNNLDVDTRSDIYALGVILYELLTGTTPLEAQRFKEAAWHEMLRLIKEEEPPRPSARLSGSGSLPSLAAQRQMEPVRLTRLVRGELDWIVMKFLEKDRSRRYDTATGLARDVGRYLADEVVEARPPSADYRMRKFARKHQAALATVAMVVLLLVAGVAVSIGQAVRATRAEGEARMQQAKAEQEEQRALVSAAEATALSNFFKELTLESRRSIKEGDKWRAKTLDESLAIIESEKFCSLFAKHPLAEADIREWAARNVLPGHHGTGSISYVGDDGAEPLAKAEFTMITPGDPPTATTIMIDADVARRRLERALQIRVAHLGPNTPKTLETMFLFGLSIRQGDFDKTIPVLGELVVRSSETLGPDHDDTLLYKRELAAAHHMAERSIRRKEGEAAKGKKSDPKAASPEIMEAATMPKGAGRHQTDRGRRLGAGPHQKQSSPVSPSYQAGYGDRCRQTVPRPGSQDGAEHPASGWIVLKEKPMRFLILLEPTATGFSAHVPDLPGCIAAGETREETVRLMREAVEFHLDGMHAHGETIRQPTSLTDYVEVDLPVAPPG